MRSLARYAEANVAVRAMLSDLLSRSDFTALIRAPSVGEAWAAFRKTAYSQTIPDASSSDSLVLERDLRTACALRFKRSTRRLHGKAVAVAGLLLSRWDLDNLEFALRYWHGGDANTLYTQSLPCFSHTILYDALSKAETLGEVVAALQHTPYAAPVAASAAVYRETKSLFHLEIALEKDHYRRLLAATTALRGADAHDGLEALGGEIDALNLAWLARLTQAPQPPLDDISAALIPGPSQLSKRLARPGSSPSALTQVCNEFATRTLPALGGTASDLQRISMMESILSEMRVASALRTFERYPFSISSVFAFFVLIRAEMKNLCTVFIGKASGMNEREIESRIRGVR